eukprot:3123640-Prymnesium_polylepis.2
MLPSHGPAWKRARTHPGIIVHISTPFSYCADCATRPTAENPAEDGMGTSAPADDGIGGDGPDKSPALPELTSSGGAAAGGALLAPAALAGGASGREGAACAAMC